MRSCWLRPAVTRSSQWDDVQPKSEAVVLCWKRLDHPLRVREELLPNVEKFMYLGVLFTNGGVGVGNRAGGD